MKLPSTANLLAIATYCTLLSACAGEDGNDLNQALAANTNMPAEAIDCISNLADEELSEEAIELLVASAQDDEARMAEIRAELSFTELTAAGMFMVSASTRCGAPLAD